MLGWEMILKGPPLIKTLLLGSWMVLHRPRPLHGLFVGGLGVGRWRFLRRAGWAGEGSRSALAGYMHVGRLWEGMPNRP
jgi:hypothetical protein